MANNQELVALLESLEKAVGKRQGSLIENTMCWIPYENKPPHDLLKEWLERFGVITTHLLIIPYFGDIKRILTFAFSEPSAISYLGDTAWKKVIGIDRFSYQLESHEQVQGEKISRFTHDGINILYREWLATNVNMGLS